MQKKRWMANRVELQPLRKWIGKLEGFWGVFLVFCFVLLLKSQEVQFLLLLLLLVPEGQNRCWKGKLWTPQTQIAASEARMPSTQWLAKTRKGFRNSPRAVHYGKGWRRSPSPSSNSSCPKKSQVWVLRCPSETKEQRWRTQRDLGKEYREVREKQETRMSELWARASVTYPTG